MTIRAKNDITFVGGNIGFLLQKAGINRISKIYGFCVFTIYKFAFIYIETTFGVHIDDTELNADTFDTLNDLVSLIQKRQA